VLYVATVHWKSDKWIDIQLRYLKRNVSEPFQTFAVLNGIDPEFDKLFDTVVPAYGMHAGKLNLLAAEIGAVGKPDDIILFLDGDAFPIADPMPANVTVTRLTDRAIVKTRFVDRDNGYRLFESKSPDLEDVRSDALPDFDDYDLVLLGDFGHGLLDARVINASLARHRRSFVAAMAQVNSTNYGYNLPTKYVGADYYSVNRAEAELCLHERRLPLCDVIERTAALLRTCALSVTDGEHGVMVKRNDDVFALPTLSTSVVDTIGCGDAYFALSSIAAALGRPSRFVALAGSIGAAAVAQRRGNERPTSEQEFLTIGKIVI